MTSSINNLKCAVNVNLRDNLRVWMNLGVSKIHWLEVSESLIVTY